MKKSLLRRGLWFFVLLVLIAPNPVRAQGKQPPPIRFTQIGDDDGLPGERILSILQDDIGFMWIGTEEGLSRYDGYTFTTYKHNSQISSSLSNNIVNTVYQDHKNTLWIGTVNGLNRLDPATGAFTRYLPDNADPTSLSHERVRAICEDASGSLWIGTLGGLNRLNPTGSGFTRFLHDEKNFQSLSNDQVWALYGDRQGMLWIGTSDGLDRFDPTTGIFIHYRHQEGNLHSLSDNQINAIAEDHNGQLWIGTSKGLNRLDRETGEFTAYRHDPNDTSSLSNDVVRALVADEEDGLWIGTEEGLNHFDPADGNFTVYKAEPDNPYSLADSAIYSLRMDRVGTLWVGTFTGGISKWDPWATQFELYFHIPNNPDSLSSNQVNTLIEDRSGQIWIGSAAPGVDSFDPQTRHFHHYHPDPTNPQSMSNSAVTVMLPETTGQLWIGTWNDGLNYFDPITGIFQHYRYNPADPQSLSSNTISALAADRAGNLWIGTLGGGLNYFDRARRTFTRYQFDENNPVSLGDNRIMALYIDSKGSLWVGLTGLGLEKFDPAVKGFIHYRHDPHNPDSIAPASVFTILEDSSHLLWLGTSSDLESFDPIQEKFTHYTTEDGLPDDYFYGILEDNQNRLWLSGNHGLSCFNPRTGEIRNYGVGNGLQGERFRQDAFLKTRSGEFYFGGTQGFNRFRPDQIRTNPYAPAIVLIDFQIFNQSVPLGNDSPLKEPIAVASKIELNYDQSVFSLAFAALDYTEPEKNNYAYRLEGVDKDWVKVDSNQRLATYTHLTPGTYIFRVKGSNNDGIWNETGTTIQIVVMPPWWMTGWFRGIVLIGVMGLLAGGLHWHFYGTRRSQRKFEQEIARCTAALSAREQNYRLILDTSMDGICRIAPDGTILFGNQAYAEIFGYRLNELIGKSYLEILADPAERPAAEARLEQLRAGKRIIGESKALHRNGHTFPIQYSFAPIIENGVVTGITGTLRDATPQHEATALLRENHERLRAVLNSIGTFIYVAETQSYKIIFINQHMQQTFGNIEGQICWQVLQQGKTGPCEFCTNPHLIDRDGQPTGIHIREYQRPQTGRWYHIQNEAIRWINGQWVRLSVATDITDLKMAQEQIATQQWQLASLAERERIGRELHDNLGQMLDYIHLQAQTVQTLLSQEKYGPAKAILIQLVRMARESNTDIRHYIMGMRDGTDRNEENQDFIETLQNYIIHLKETYSFLTRFSFPEERAELRLTSAVETQLLRIVQEALTNIRKHAGVKNANLQLQWDKQTVQILIEDQGIGFIPEQTSTDAHFGLKIMHERAVQIGGNLRVRSALGRGTQVIVRAPRLLPEKENKDIDGMRVLLVDDHRLFMEGLRSLLTLHGMQVVGFAVNGEEAIAQAQVLLPDLILMDINMPHCDGITATQRIKELLPATRVVILTMTANEESLFAALKAGASGYLLKGLDNDEFCRLLHELIQGEVPLASEMTQLVLGTFMKAKEISSISTSSQQKLTPQQNGVLELLAQGLTYKEVGQQLNLSERTVRYHLEQILIRLQVENRHAAVEYYIRHIREK